MNKGFGLMRRIVFGIMLMLVITTSVLTFYCFQPTESPFEFGTADSWVWVRDTIAGAWGEAVVGTGNAIYVARRSSFYLYNPSDNSWGNLTTPPNPDSGDAFKTGTALTWDFGDYIYALYGAATVDSRRWFYRYSISLNSWEALANTTVDQGEGDAITWVGIDNYIYATIGGEQRPTYFMRYDPLTNSWSDIPADPPEGMGDGASLVCTNGDFLYALRGEDDETSPLYDFWRYSLTGDVWTALADIPADAHDDGGGGVGDGGSLLYVGFWLPNQTDHIYALSGNQAHPDNIPDSRTYRYTISTNSWERLADLPFGVGYYVGCRLGYTDGDIYAWQGTPGTWPEEGDDLAKYEFAPTPRTWIVDDDGPADFDSIQEAINAANPGDTIQVRTGTYYEPIAINKAILLIGENRNATIIDGNGTGTVVLISANNINVTNFTVRNAGRNWGPPPGTGYPDSCILGSGVTHVNVENNALSGAAVCVWFAYSSFVNACNNIVFNATYAGIIGYTSSNITIYHNLVNNCGLMGIHLDDNCNDCKIATNTVTNNLEGIELERESASNLVKENHLINNNVSIVLNRCGSLNVLRRNNMTSSHYNLMVFGYDLDSFMQDIDDSNIVNNKTVYYLTNLNDMIIRPSNYPNAGYLAVVNCANTTVRDINITRNGDGVLLAYSAKCTLTNITLSENRGPLLCGGLTFYKSNNNTIVNNKISNNTCAICLYHSDENIFYHNNFIQNDRQVAPDFLAPFTDESSGYFSLNVWDNNLEGNYWSDYTGLDENRNGIGDSSYLITPSPSIPPESKQYDRCPLMGIFHSYDVSYVVSGCKVKVVSNSTISNFAVPIWIEHPELRWIEFNVTGETGIGFCRICIPYKLMSPPYNVTIDNGETLVLYINNTICDNGTHRWIYLTYPHTTHKVIIIPEFLSNTIVAIFMITSLIATIMAKKRRNLWPEI